MICVFSKLHLLAYRSDVTKTPPPPVTRSTSCCTPVHLSRVLMELRDLLRFRHCSRTIYTLVYPAGPAWLRCPVCGQVVRLSLTEAPVRIRTPITDGHRAACSFLITSQHGAAGFRYSRQFSLFFLSGLFCPDYSGPTWSGALSRLFKEPFKAQLETENKNAADLKDKNKCEIKTVSKGGGKRHCPHLNTF